MAASHFAVQIKNDLKISHKVQIVPTPVKTGMSEMLFCEKNVLKTILTKSTHHCAPT
jgi:hypothetical protein